MEHSNAIIQRKARPPFLEELVDAGFSKEKLKTFIADPEKIVRINDLEEGRESLEALREEVSIGKALLEELRDEYQIPMPNFEFLIGYDEEKNPRVYTITQRVHGANLQNLFSNHIFGPSERERILIDADVLCSCLCQYVGDVYAKRGKWLRDPCYVFQYLYGRRKSETKDQIYLVDLDYHY